MGQALKHRQAGKIRPTFVLTSLIDVMFLLLMFFMLSSQMAPYSLLPMGNLAGLSDERPSTGAVTPYVLAIRVSRGFVTIGGQRIAADDVTSQVAGLVSHGVQSFLVICTGRATVQDIVATLEALKVAEADNVALVNASGSAR
ncbi:biopolymer transporter ExbD [Mesorhizobium sp. WSM2239]|uniref:Biopolymer transporter ExbD n=2 Tax=unclassified Mesorhizobium TaxID=325217 RepID=A0AAU8DGA4_9HYPH